MSRILSTLAASPDSAAAAMAAEGPDKLAFDSLEFTDGFLFTGEVAEGEDAGPRPGRWRAKSLLRVGFTSASILRRRARGKKTIATKAQRAQRPETQRTQSENQGFLCVSGLCALCAFVAQCLRPWSSG